jgi:hypothetical protein
MTLIAALDELQDRLAPPLKQLRVLCGRQVHKWRRSPVMLIGEGVQYLFLGAFVGGMYFDVSSKVGSGVFDRTVAGFFIVATIAF